MGEGRLEYWVEMKKKRRVSGWGWLECCWSPQTPEMVSSEEGCSYGKEEGIRMREGRCSNKRESI